MTAEPEKTQRPPAPNALDDPGRELWESVHSDLGDAFELTAKELELLALASRQRDEIARVEAALDGDGVVIAGSKGQPRLNGALAELRQMRLAVAKLLGEIDAPGPEDVPTRAGTARSQRASHAARARWAEVERRKGTVSYGAS